MPSSKIHNTVDEIKKLIWSKSFHSYSDSIVANFVLRIFKDNKLEESDLYGLFSELHKIEMTLSLADSLLSTKTKLSNWLFSLCKPSAASGGKALREWLVENKIDFQLFQQYQLVEIKDVFDFGAGFLLGVSKSLVYDNVKGIYDLLKLTTVDAVVFLYDQEKDSLNRLAQEYLKESERSKLLTVQSSAKFANEITNTFLTQDPFSDLKRINSFANYLTELRTIFISFCLNPYMRTMNSNIDGLFQMLSQLMDAAKKEISSESKEFNQASSIVSYIKNKYDRELETKVHPLLLQFRFFEAGAVFGELIANIAQIIAGLIMLLWNARKLIAKVAKIPVRLSEQLVIKLSRLSFASKARLGSVLTLISFWPAEFKVIPTIFSDSPFFTLALKGNKKEYLKIGEAVKKGMPFIEFQGASLIDLEVAGNLAPSEDAAKAIKAIASPISGVPQKGSNPFLFSFGGIFIAMVPRRKGSKEGAEDDAFVAEIITRFQELYQEDALSAFLSTAETNKTLLSKEHFFREVAEREKIVIAAGATSEIILKALLKSWVEEFEKEIISKIKGGLKFKFKKKGIWTVFNSHINKKLRPVAEALKNRGTIILIDQRFLTLTEKVLKLDAIIVFEGKETTIRKLMGMTVIDFYETYFPQKLYKQRYLKAIQLLEKEHPNTYQLFKERDEALKDIEHALKSNKPKDVIDALSDRHDGISDYIGVELEGLVQKELISGPYKEELQMYQFGKINPFGKCGMTRPDIGFVSIFEGTMNYDFVHVMEGSLPSDKHLIGSDFYLDFKTVLFGKTPLDTSFTKDITYTFSKDFLDMLEP